MLSYDLNGKNKYWKLYSLIRDDILSGRFACGEKLPSKRDLAEGLGVSVVTVQTAYDQLLAEGYISSKERSGYFVSGADFAFYGSKDVPMSKKEEKREYALDLVKGSPPAGLFPFSVWAKLMRKVLADCGEHLLERVPCDGDYGLKRSIASYLYRTRGISANPEYIVIGAGAEYLYGIIVQLLGRDKLFAVENPGYGKISASYRLNGAECAYIGVDGNGVILDEVEKSNADVLHISPSHQYPTGAVIPAFTRSSLIKWAQAGGRYIIEDDYDSEFRLFGKPLQSMYSLCPDRVIYMNTFSKSLAPSMRMGYMVLPSELYAKYSAVFGYSACAVPLFEQKTLSAMLDGGHFERHINRLKNHYRSVREEVLKKCESFGERCRVCDTGSGHHLLAQFPSAPSDGYIKEVALKNGINLRCVSDYLLAPAKIRERCAVINYSSLNGGEIEGLNIKL